MWNERNQLASMNLISESFQYDPLGRRVAKTILGTTTNYLYDGANPVQELSGTTPTANLLTGGVDEYFTRTDSTGTANFLTDALGSTIQLTNSTGGTIASYTYEPFGNTTATGSSTNTYQYTGRENDGTGVYFYRARYYSPTLQRFDSEDRLGFAGGLNLYRYVGYDPNDMNDPHGLCQISVGYHPVGPDLFILMPMGMPDGGIPLPANHTCIVLGGRYDNRTVLEAEPNGPWPFWKISATTYPLIPGLDPNNPVWTDPEVYITDDGRSCSDDARTLNNYANSIDNSGVSYWVFGPNSNSATHGGLNALGVNGWQSPVLAPGWNSPIPH